MNPVANSASAGVIRSAPYKLGRFELAYLAASEYLRTFWWYAAIIPFCGLLALIFAEGSLKVFGLMGLLWPLTIPGRSLLSSSKSSRLFTQDCFVEADQEQVAFYSVATEPKRLRFVLNGNDIRDVIERGELLLVRTRRFGIAPIKRAAFTSPEQEDSFIRLVAGMVQRRLDSVPDA